MAEAPTGDELLTPDDAVNVLEEIIEAQNQSYVLGLKLKLPPHVVEGICEAHSQPRDRLLQILTEFLKQADPRPTWRAIVAALRSPAVNLLKLGMTMEAAHFPKPSASRDPTPATTSPTVTIAKSDEATTDVSSITDPVTAPPQPSDAVVSSVVPVTSTSLSVPSASTATSLTSKPTLPELLNLKTTSGTAVNIVHQIGTRYSTLGPLLLNDENGAVTPAIVDKHQRNADAINQEILTRWLQGQGKLPVTWSTFLDVLRDAGLSELNQSVQKNLNILETSPAQNSVFPSVATVQSPVTTQLSQRRSESHLSATDHETHQPPSPQQGQMTVQYVQAKIKQFEKRFNALKKSTRECLERLRVSVKRVADALTSLPADDMDEHKLFLKENKIELYRAPDHYELFGTMNFHWNYQNYELLDHLIQEFNLEGVKGMMKKYKEDLQRFRKKTLLKLFCQSQKRKHIKPPPDFHEVVAEFDWPDDVTLDVVEEFRQEYAYHYSLHMCAMMLGVVLSGSFIITWFIPGCIIEQLKVKVPTSILDKYSVTKLEIAGECVYSKVMKKKMEADLHNNLQLKPFVLSNVTPIGADIGAGAYGNVTICGAAKDFCSVIPRDDISRALTQFVKECQVMSTLRHPNIVQFLGVCFFEGSRLPALVIERLLTSLHDLLAPETQLPPGTPGPLSFFKLSLKCSVLHNVANGLAYLHERTPPIIHHDLSAKNVLLTTKLVAKIADLGVARIVTRRVAQVYMPPEVTNIEKWMNDASVDVFSLGVLTIFTVGEAFPKDPHAATYTNQMTGKLEARNEMQRRSIYMQNVKTQLHACGQLREDHPLLRLIQNCLDNIPTKRPNIGEVLGLLEEARAGIRDEESEKSRVELVQALQNQPRNQNLNQNLAADVAELQQHPSGKGAELAKAEETTRKEQQQIQDMRGQEILMEKDKELSKKDELVQPKDKELQHQLRKQLTVECQKKKRAPRVISRGSATNDDQFAYFTTQGSRSVYKYEFKMEKWEELPQSPYRYSGLVIIDGKLTAVGGRGESGCTNKLVTLQEGQWVECYPSMNTARSQTAIVRTADGNHIFVIGGSVDHWTDTVELFHVRSRTWYKLTNLPQALTIPSATICGNQLCVIGGKDNGYSCSLEALPSSDQPITSLSISWKSLPRLPVILSTVATLCGQLLIIGGDQSEDQGRISKFFSVDPDVNTIYQLVDDQWEKIGAMSVTRSECLVVDSSPDEAELLIVGGVDERGVDICFVQNR